MRDHYVANVSDVVKFAFLRALAGSDRRLGIAWYYRADEAGQADGEPLGWAGEPAWRELDATLCSGLLALPQRSVAVLEQAPIWPQRSLFYREPLPAGAEREAWAARSRSTLEAADLVFLDPDTGVGRASPRHVTLWEIRQFRKLGRAVAFVHFPGRTKPHDALLQELHAHLAVEVGAIRTLTLRIHVDRQCWLSVVDPDVALVTRIEAFAAALGRVPGVRVRLDG